MPILNLDIAAIFNRVADLLDIKGANPFRIRAYRRAARMVEELSGEISEMVEAGEDLTNLPGIGKDLAGKMEETVAGGSLAFLEELERDIPPGLTEIMEIQGIGPRKAQTIHQELGISSINELKKAVKQKKIRELDGFGEKTEANISDELKRLADSQHRLKLATADRIAGPLLAYLRQDKEAEHVEIAGSYRRRRETVGDLDILVSHNNGTRIMERFVEYEDVEKILSHGKTRSSVILRSGLQVDLRAVDVSSYGAALLYFTGSKAHNIEIRKIAMGKNLKINEYGVFKGKKRIAGRTEKEVYGKIGLPFIAPELRENRGEVAAAADKSLPTLITLEDIRGDLHCHTRLTDGKATIEEMAEAAMDLGYEYLAITEHSKRMTVAGGLHAGQLRDLIDRVDRLNDKGDGILILKGIEVDILEDGSLDLPDDVLRQLDFTICSIHSAFNLPRRKQTERIIRAMDNPCFNILGHPTGRLINQRAPYDVDMENIIRAAAERGCFMELNAHPDRLDLNDIHLRLARDQQVKVAISTDAHSLKGLKHMRFGIWQARRGWIEADDVLNSKRWKELGPLFKRG